MRDESSILSESNMIKECVPASHMYLSHRPLSLFWWIDTISFIRNTQNFGRYLFLKFSIQVTTSVAYLFLNYG